MYLSAAQGTVYARYLLLKDLPLPGWVRLSLVVRALELGTAGMAKTLEFTEGEPWLWAHMGRIPEGLRHPCNPNIIWSGVADEVGNGGYVVVEEVGGVIVSLKRPRRENEHKGTSDTVGDGGGGGMGGVGIGLKHTVGKKRGGNAFGGVGGGGKGRERKNKGK